MAVLDKARRSGKYSAFQEFFEVLLRDMPVMGC